GRPIQIFFATGKIATESDDVEDQIKTANQNHENEQGIGERIEFSHRASVKRLGDGKPAHRQSPTGSANSDDEALGGQGKGFAIHRNKSSNATRNAAATRRSRNAPTRRTSTRSVEAQPPNGS